MHSVRLELTTLPSTLLQREEVPFELKLIGRKPHEFLTTSKINDQTDSSLCVKPFQPVYFVLFSFFVYLWVVYVCFLNFMHVERFKFCFCRLIAALSRDLLVDFVL
jgi:hypothetical protein